MLLLFVVSMPARGHSFNLGGVSLREVGSSCRERSIEFTCRQFDKTEGLGLLSGQLPDTEQHRKPDVQHSKSDDRTIDRIGWQSGPKLMNVREWAIKNRRKLLVRVRVGTVELLRVEKLSELAIDHGIDGAFAKIR